jgi:FMN-dependent NADH-azoreductase
MDSLPRGEQLTLLHIDASARFERSISRRLSAALLEEWTSLRPGDQVRRRDLAANPPPHVSEDWIAASFTPEDKRTDAMRKTLAYSESAIAELATADVIVLGTPMYNYGMPSALKAWFDQVIRIGRTFSFDLARGDWPLEPMLSGKQMVVVSARGEFGFQSGGPREKENHLDPHIATLAHFLGVARDDIHLIDVEYQEFRDDRFARSLAAAEPFAVHGPHARHRGQRPGPICT